jgi:PleD family two-component response regulator
VLLDVMMPGKTGFEVCQAVRADEAAGHQNPDAHRQGPRHRRGQGPGAGRRRLHDQALLHRELVQKVRRTAWGDIRMRKIDPRLVLAMALRAW